MNLTSVKDVQKILKDHKFPIRKKYGQNFLVDENIMEKIVRAADLNSDSLVLEIGPGLGSLTQYLALTAKKVVAIEIDELLIPILEKNLEAYKNVELIHADALKYDWSKIYQPDDEVVIVSNLPYYITSPLLEKMVSAPFSVPRAVVLVQKEVALRMTAAAGTSDYGSLSAYLQSQGELDFVAPVSRQVFHPKPKVDSAIVKIEFKQQLQERIVDQIVLEKVLRSVFGQRRKTLRNSLLNSPHLKIDKEVLAEIERSFSFSWQIRGEDLSPGVLVDIANSIADKINQIN